MVSLKVSSANAPATEPILSLRNVTVQFHSDSSVVHACEDISLDLRKGEFVTVVGPSGCGKSTVMNVLVGLTQPTSGAVYFKGAEHTGVNTKIGYVTQEDNLFPWRTTIGSVEFAMEVQGIPTAQRRQRAQALIDAVGLRGFENHYRHQLSGGMRQRANIIRTLAYRPEVILMDEPFGPLDAHTRLILQDQLLQLWQQEQATVVFITHDLHEAIALADRVVVMSRRPGRIRAVREVQIPRPRDLFTITDSPAYQALYDDLWSILRDEVQEEGE